MAKQKQDWLKAENHIREVIHSRIDLKNISLTPTPEMQSMIKLRSRLEIGEQSKPLYDAIMKIK